MVEAGYEGGTAMAPRQGSAHDASCGPLITDGGCGEVQSVHVCSTKLGPPEFIEPSMRGPEIAGPTDGWAFETTAGAFVSDYAKKDACAALQGRTLGTCGEMLVQKLLEVVSLRSQPQGKRTCGSLFPFLYPPLVIRFLRFFLKLILEKWIG